MAAAGEPLQEEQVIRHRRQSVRLAAPHGIASDPER
jgi:hypothetical protein